MKDRTPEEKLDLILEGVSLLLELLAAEDPEEDDLEHMEPVGPPQ